MQEHCSIEFKDAGVYLANEKKTKIVAFITLFTMVAEISVGYWSGSMALLADGWHMASHALALFLALLVYYLYRHPPFRSAFTFGGGKILSLGGYTSAIFLVIIALSMIWESITRFFEAETIQYKEAMVVAIIGLVVNLICAWILHPADHSHGHCHGHDHDHHHHGHAKDHTHHSTYVHILTDALTSVLAIIALALGMWKGWSWLDPTVGILGGIVVFKWSLNLIRESGLDLLDAHVVGIDREKLVERLEQDGSKVMDLHLWKLAPDQVGCEIIIKSNKDQKSADYRDAIRDFELHHVIIEVC